MASPQLEDGYTRIANELVEALAGFRLAGQECQVVWAIFRKTYGYNKKEDRISHGQISTMTKLPRTKVVRLVKALVSKKVLGSANNGTRQTATIWINKNYDSWIPSPKKDTTPLVGTHNGTIASTNIGTKASPNNGTHKRKKDNLQKTRDISSDFLEFSRLFLETQQKRNPTLLKKITEPMILNGADAVRLFVDDGFSLEQIKKVMKWAIQDGFWYNKILSLSSLRTKSKNGQWKLINIMASMDQDDNGSCPGSSWSESRSKIREDLGLHEDRAFWSQDDNRRYKEAISKLRETQ